MNAQNDGSDGKNETPPISLSAEHIKENLVRELLLNQLIEIREAIQKELFDTCSPEREACVQKANFIYALIHKVKDEYKSPHDIRVFVDELKEKYPMADETVRQVKNLPGV